MGGGGMSTKCGRLRDGGSAINRTSRNDFCFWRPNQSDSPPPGLKYILRFWRFYDPDIFRRGWGGLPNERTMLDGGGGVGSAQKEVFFGSDVVNGWSLGRFFVNIKCTTKYIKIITLIVQPQEAAVGYIMYLKQVFRRSKSNYVYIFNLFNPCSNWTYFAWFLLKPREEYPSRHLREDIALLIVRRARSCKHNGVSTRPRYSKTLLSRELDSDNVSASCADFRSLDTSVFISFTCDALRAYKTNLRNVFDRPGLDEYVTIDVNELMKICLWISV